MTCFLENAALISLIFFFGVFLWVAFCTYRPSVKHSLQSHALIPLEDDSHG